MQGDLPTEALIRSGDNLPEIYNYFVLSGDERLAKEANTYGKLYELMKDDFDPTFEKVIDYKVKAKGDEIISLELRTGLIPGEGRGIFITKTSSVTGEMLATK